jgi:hypothetical protein
LGLRTLALFSGVLVIAAVPACGDEVEPPTEDDGGGASGGNTGVPSTATAVTVTTTTGPGPDIGCFNGYTNVASGTCDLLSQNDCPPGQGCVPERIDSVWTATCIPNAGVKDIGDPCVSDLSCRAGLFCNQGRCGQACCPESNEPCTAYQGLCISVNFAAYELALCAYPQTCELFSGDCTEPQHCYPIFGAGNSFCFDEAVDNPFPEGQPCDALNECDDSLTCYGTTCRWACKLDSWQTLSAGGGGCPAGQSCVENGPLPPENIGVCLP